MNTPPPADLLHIFRSLPTLVVILAPDPKFSILDVSDAYLAATCTQRESMLGHGIFEIFAPEPSVEHAATMSNLRASLEQVVATATADSMGIQQYDLRRVDDPVGSFEERYWRPVNTPVLSASGEVLYIIHSVEDVTELMHARRVTEDLPANDILESITEGFLMLDREWRFTYVNRAAQEILGRSRGDLIGRTLWDEYQITGTAFESAYRTAMESQQAPSLAAYYPDHDRWYEVHVYPAPDGLAIYFRNVTAQKRADLERQSLLAASENQRRIFEVALSNTPDLVYVFDLDHRFIYANEALLAMWGRTAEHSLGKTCLELGYEPWHAAMHDREIEQVKTTCRPIRGEVPFTGTNGRRIYDYIFTPVLDPDGTVVAVAGTTRDVTERQQNEQAIREQAERLTEADRAKDEFLATLAHELRNPLAPLRNSLALLRLTRDANDAPNPALTPIHDMMERQVNHLVRLVDDLLEMSRISRGTLTLRKERVDVATIVRNAVETGQPLIQAAGHKLAVSLPPQQLWLEGDPVRLAQILSNLLDNAAKYTADGGQLGIIVSHDDDEVIITVRDNGTGIEADDLPRIFGMFSRGDPAGGRGQGGLGIGLALARRLASMHGGSLGARSDGPGRGSEFTVRLPLARDSAPGMAHNESGQEHMAHKRILVVDDNRDAADSLALLLDILGADVRVAHDGPAALEAFDAHDPAVVLLDIGMPGMDGYEVARTLRARHPAHKAFIVALTGWGQEDDRRRAREAGFDHHLIKPAEISTLQRLLNALDDTSQALPADV